MDTNDPLLEPVDGDAPCGPNLEYDAAFLTLESLAAARPERAVGDAVKQAEEPDWRDVARQAEQLLQRTRDVRIAIHLGHAWLKSSGLSAWARSLGLVAAWLERYWDELYPRLDDGDPVERINALAALTAIEGSVGHLRDVAILSVERVGAFSLRDLRLLNGTLKSNGATDDTSASQDTVDAVLQHVEVATLLAADAAISEAIAHAQAIGRVFELRTPGMGPDLEPLERDLRELHIFLRAQVAIRVPDALAEPAEIDPPANGDIAAQTNVMPSRGSVRGTDDVLRMLDDICAWYARHEPSSPVPQLLRRASRMVGLSFAELLRTLAPAGLSEFQQLAGEDEAN